MRSTITSASAKPLFHIAVPHLDVLEQVAVFAGLGGHGRVGRAGEHGVIDHRQHIVFDLDQAQRFGCNLFVVGRDNRDGIAHVAHFLAYAHHHRPVEMDQAVNVLTGDVRGGQDGRSRRAALSPCGCRCEDDRVRVGRTQRAGEQHAGESVIVGKLCRDRSLFAHVLRGPLADRFIGSSTVGSFTGTPAFAALFAAADLMALITLV